MKQNKINSPRVIVWHKFMRRSYSAFMSLHKVIAVGVLSVATLSTADLKAQTVMLAQTSERDTAELNYELDDVEVTGERVPLSVSLMPRVVAVMTKTDVQAAAVHSRPRTFRSILPCHTSLLHEIHDRSAAYSPLGQSRRTCATCGPVPLSITLSAFPP